MNVTSELISRYADGQVTPEERAAVEAALRDDPQAAIEFDEFGALGELFGHVEPETVSEECLEALYALDQAPAPEFELVEVASARSFAWGGWMAAAAALFLAVYGILQLAHTPEVTLRDFARLTLDSEGAVVRTERLDAVTRRSGESIVAGPRQRITYRDPLGARVVLMPESRIDVGDPRDGRLLDLREGTALLTVYDSADPRIVRAGGYVLRSQGADFGVRVIGAERRSAGAASEARAPEVIVAVRSGRCEIGENGGREEVEAHWSVTLRRGAPATRSRIWESPLFAALLEGRGHQILPGFYSSEAGVRAILGFEWDRLSPTEFELVVSATESVSVARWFVAEVELAKPSALELIRTRPLRGGERTAMEATVSTSVVPAGRHVVAIPLDAFASPEARVRRVEIPVDRSRLVRIRLRSQNEESPLKIHASLWSARPPADAPEVVR